jgi:hypothetical protein
MAERPQTSTGKPPKFCTRGTDLTQVRSHEDGDYARIDSV